MFGIRSEMGPGSLSGVPGPRKRSWKLFRFSFIFQDCGSEIALGVVCCAVGNSVRWAVGSIGLEQVVNGLSKFAVFWVFFRD